MLNVNRFWQLVVVTWMMVLVGQAEAECSSNRNAAIEITRPDARYTDNLDGTVTDKGTGLMWQKCSLGQSWNTGSDANSGADDSCDGVATGVNWMAALTAANDSVDYGYSDWYLPNKNELASITELACFDPSINESLFPATVADRYWSSSPYVGSDALAFFVRFDNGAFGGSMKSGSFYVRMVRAAE